MIHRSPFSGAAAISWAASDGSALAPATVTLPGLVIRVDPAASHRVVSLDASDPQHLLERATLIGGTSVAVDLARDPGSVERLRLSPSGTRLGAVAAVDQIHLGDLDEPLLQLDLAMALLGAEENAAARKVFALAASATERIAHRIDEDGVGGPVLAALLQIVAELGPAATGTLRAWLQRMRARAELRDSRLNMELTELLSDRPTALTLGTDQSETEPSSLQLADLRPIPPRLLRFTGPGDPDLRVLTSGEGVLTVTASLRDDVIPDTSEVLGLFAVAAHSQTGRLLAAAPIRVVAHELLADLHLPGRTPDEVRCGLIGSDSDPDAVRLDRLGSAVTEVDRHLRYGWTMHRRAGAIRAAIDPGAEPRIVSDAAALAAMAHGAASDAVDDAQQLLRQAARRARGTPDAEALRTFAQQIDALAATIDGPPEIGGPAGPTITEIAAETLR